MRSELRSTITLTKQTKFSKFLPRPVSEDVPTSTQDDRRILVFQQPDPPRRETNTGSRLREGVEFRREVEISRVGYLGKGPRLGDKAMAAISNSGANGQLFSSEVFS